MGSAEPKSVLDPFTSFGLESPVLGVSGPSGGTQPSWRMAPALLAWDGPWTWHGGYFLWEDTQNSPEKFFHTLAACPSQSAQSRYSVQGLTQLQTFEKACL